MPDFEREPDRAWDEYDWERFLQQQDQKTEKYMDLLEKYLDDPQRDEIIAREMGWSGLAGENDWSDEVDALMNEDWRPTDENEQSSEQKIAPTETFEEHGLYRAAFALTVWIDKLFDAITLSMEAAGRLVSDKLIAAAQYAVLQQRLFQVRDGIITLMGEYRGEWRRRFGSEGFRS